MEQINQAIIEFLKLFCDESRLAIIEFLKDNRKTQIEIQNHLEKSQSRISQNLKLLIQAGIIGFDQDGVKKTYYLKDSRVFKLIGMVVSNDFPEV